MRFWKRVCGSKKKFKNYLSRVFGKHLESEALDEFWTISQAKREQSEQKSDST